MSDADHEAVPRPASEPLPDAVHQAVGPGTVVLRLVTTHDRESVLDGAWWPRSRDIASELPALIAALTEYLGPVARVGLDATAWEGLPTRMVLDGRVVHVDSFPVGDDTVLVTRGAQDHFSLLVIPPHADLDAAQAAMAASVRAGNTASAAHILIRTGIDRSRGLRRGSSDDP